MHSTHKHNEHDLNEPLSSNAAVSSRGLLLILHIDDKTLLTLKEGCKTRIDPYISQQPTSS